MLNSNVPKNIGYDVTIICNYVFRYEPVLLQEMLNLIIQILKERRFCGLTTAQSLQRELIYKLSSGNATHSQLVKSLPRDLSKANQLQQVLNTVAEYSHPSGTKQVTIYENRPLP